MSALLFLSSQKIHHQDLKPGNIVFSKDMKCIKICDFGFATGLDQTIIGQRRAENGTRHFEAPEQFDLIATIKSDVWSFGCTLLNMITKEMPYHDIESLQIVQKLNHCTPLEYARLKLPKEKFQILDEHPELETILVKCFERNHLKRISLEEIF